MPLVVVPPIRDSGPVTLTAAQKSTPFARIHWAWVVAVVSFIAILGAAGFRSVPGVMMNPLHHEFGWSHGVVGLAMSAALLLGSRAISDRPEVLVERTPEGGYRLRGVRTQRWLGWPHPHRLGLDDARLAPPGESRKLDGN